MNTLFDVPTARHADPATSKLAAQSVRTATISECQERILQALASGGKTDPEIVALVGRQMQVSESGIRTRRSELVRAGLVRDSGLLVTLQSGRKAVIWEKC